MYHVDSEECSNGARMPEIFGMHYKLMVYSTSYETNRQHGKGLLFYTVFRGC